MRHEASPLPIVIYTDFVQQWAGNIVTPRLTTAKPPPQDPTRGLLQGTFNIVTMSTVSFPRSCIDKVGMFDIDLKTGQDWDFYLRASARYRFVHLEQYSVVYYHHFRDRLTADYRVRLESLRIIKSKWQLNVTFVRNKTRLWKYMAIDDMIYAASKSDMMGKYKALRYFFAFPAPFASPVLLAKLLVVAVLPYPLYSAIVRRCHRDREAEARVLLQAVKVLEHRALSPGCERVVRQQETPRSPARSPGIAMACPRDPGPGAPRINVHERSTGRGPGPRLRLRSAPRPAGPRPGLSSGPRAVPERVEGGSDAPIAGSGRR